MAGLEFYVYILASGYNGTLYIGHTDNLEVRVKSHRGGAFPGSFTDRYHVHRLVYVERFASRHEAFTRERQLKHYTRLRKIKLIEQDNPRWADLAADW